ncbi:uncharacterized protein LOC129000409 [Macrosteles quadrilineatus]|uniref:uncharacterized protein LOC129000409 n=1 Tax=Macrosteles quadrilineatus TaxID=74068 RepID=UPI0023E10FD1|nr:uncharacterized protein LOC129000409 [Macrosteles quadrilineatus]
MEEHKVVQTKQGSLRGSVKYSSFSDKRYYSFVGIPFAKPPVGTLRFKDPEPFGEWTGVRDALQDGNKCKQGILVRNPGVDPNNISEVGDEDCLYLCVFTNKLPEESPTRSPVMVYIHGGAFAGGSGISKSINPEFLLEGDTVLVTINYRCGAFGFLSLENEEVPGNAGLKDQTLALRWVQDNIDIFGGDSNNVTIFGISAGGASVHYHLLSPMSKGLFHKAIIQSGFCLMNEWSLQRSPNQLAFTLAKKLGFESEDDAEVFRYLQTVPSEDILSATHEFCKDQEYITWIGLLFTACVETAGSNKFLHDTPTNLMKRGEFSKVPVILGAVENEGNVHTFLSQTCFSFDSIPEIINNRPELLVPPFFKLNPGSKEEKDVQKAIWEFYLKGEQLSLKNFQEFTKYESDFLIIAGLGETRRLMLEKSKCPVYTYLFTNHTKCFCSGLSGMLGADNPVLPYLSGPGTCHAADSVYLTKHVTDKLDLTPEFKQAVNKHVQAWTNFAKSGDPNVAETGVRWTPDSQSSPCYMDIGTDWTVKEGVPFADRINFWLQLSDRYLTYFQKQSYTDHLKPSTLILPSYFGSNTQVTSPSQLSVEMEDFVVIETKLGSLRGKVCKTGLSNKKYYSFLGIPYGQPPVGALRFKAPRPFGGWEGVRNALQDGDYSKQSTLFTIVFEGKSPEKAAAGDEDCLNLGVFINELPGNMKSKRPVMVSIHGGGFALGSGNSNILGMDFLMEEDVVVVSFNYRCGALGFLSLGTEEVPGNAGLKDQTLALRWVQDNIDSFGGDPNNVTIFGISAGGASVHYHLLSPLSKGLFHKAIMQSGFAQNLWAFQPSPKTVALKLAKMLGCTSEDPQEVLRFLQSVPSDDIIIAQSTICAEKENIKSGCSVFSPCVEIKGKNKFLSDTPNKIMRSGEYNKVPTMLGVCQNEGSTFQSIPLLTGLKVEEILSFINSSHEILVPHFLNLQPGSCKQKNAIKDITEFYFKREPLTLNNFSKYVKYHSDLQFNLGFSETRKYLVANSSLPTYSYFFTNHSGCSSKRIQQTIQLSSGCVFESETCHGDDTIYIYKSPLTMPELTSEYRQAVSKHVKVWTTFAMTGNPNSEALGVKWKPDTECSPCCMDIGTEWRMREGVPFTERTNFWHQLTKNNCKL